MRGRQSEARCEKPCNIMGSTRAGQWASLTWLRHFAQIILECAPGEAELRQQIAPQVGRAAEAVVIFWPLEHAEPLPDVVELGVKRGTAGRRRLDTGQRGTNLRRSLRTQLVRPLDEAPLGRSDQLERVCGQRARTVLVVVRHGRERGLKRRQMRRSANTTSNGSRGVSASYVEPVAAVKYSWRRHPTLIS